MNGALGYRISRKLGSFPLSHIHNDRYVHLVHRFVLFCLQSCKAVGAVAETVGADMPEAEAAEMSAALMEELPGRLWDVSARFCPFRPFCPFLPFFISALLFLALSALSSLLPFYHSRLFFWSPNPLSTSASILVPHHRTVCPSHAAGLFLLRQ